MLLYLTTPAPADITRNNLLDLRLLFLAALHIKSNLTNSVIVPVWKFWILSKVIDWGCFHNYQNFFKTAKLFSKLPNLPPPILTPRNHRWGVWDCTIYILLPELPLHYMSPAARKGYYWRNILQNPIVAQTTI